jgi:hypothetical protein
MTDRLDVFRERVKSGTVICPQPQPWNRLWELLPGRIQRGGGWEPPLPLILDGWWYSTDTQKSLRFQQHLDWASSHGATDAVFDYLNSLSPADWHTS